MNDSALTRFFGVVVRPRTWLGIVFQLLAFPLGLFYFVFLITGLSVGVSLVVVWIGIPILLVVAGAWWLLAAFERVQARYLLGAEIPPAPRPWERADGVWGKLKAHFGSGSTWRDLVYLITKLVFGMMSFGLLVMVTTAVGTILAMPFLAAFHVPVVNGTWVPPLWFGALCVPLGILVLVLSLHLLNAWGWVCARWAEVIFRVGPPVARPVLPPSGPLPTSGPLPPPELLARPETLAPPAPPAEPAAPAPAETTGAPVVEPATPAEPVAELAAPAEAETPPAEPAAPAPPAEPAAAPPAAPEPETRPAQPAVEPAAQSSVPADDDPAS